MHQTCSINRISKTIKRHETRIISTKMSLTRFFPETSLFGTFDPFLETDLLADPFLRSSQQNVARSVPIDLQETDTAYLIKADLPGFKKNQIELNAEGSSVYISAKLEEVKEEKNVQFRRKERSTRDVRRTVRLPMDIQADKIEARVEDGVLHLNVPKCPKAQAKKIAVK